MKTILIFTLILSSLTSQAKEFYPAKILLLDGNEKIGYAPLPSNKRNLIPFISNPKNAFFYFKAEKIIAPIKIKSDDIFRVIFTLDNGNQYLFERNGTINITKSFYEKREKKCKKSEKYWLLQTYHSANISVYNLANYYFIDKKGNMISKSTGSSDVPISVITLIKRPNESCPSTISYFFGDGALMIGSEKRFRKIASIYFKDNEDLVNRIKNKEFKSNEAVKLAKTYNESF